MQAISQNFDNSRGDLSDFLDIYQTFVRLLGNLLKFNNSRGDYSDFLDIYQTCVRFLGNLPKT